MFSDLIKNYKTKNQSKDAYDKQWCISPMLGKGQQVAVQLTAKKTYDYISRYAVTEGAVAVIGREYPQYNYTDTNTGPNSGAMGRVVEVIPAVTLNRDYAFELDYVFLPESGKKELKRCVKFLAAAGEKAYYKTIMLDKFVVPVRPITYHIQKILAAASVLAQPKLVKPEELELAKTVLLEKKQFERDWLALDWGPPEDYPVSLAEIHIYDPAAADYFEEIGKVLNNRDWKAEEGILDAMSKVLSRFTALDEVNDFINSYAHLGAISIMVRGGFKNLLEAYLAAEPISEELRAKAKELLAGIGHAKVYELLG